MPYFAWNIIQWIGYGCNIESLSLMVLQPDCYLWFLWVLFWIFTIFIIARNIAIKINIDELYLIGAVCVLLMGLMVVFEIRKFGFQFISYYFLFYALGYCIHRFNVLQIKNKVLLSILTIIWAAMAWYWNMHELPSWLQGVSFIPSSLLQYAYRGVTAMLALMAIFGIAPSVLNKASKINSPIIYVGVFSLGMYACHLSFMRYIISGLRIALPTADNVTIIIMTFVLSVISTSLIVNFLSKNKYTSKVFLGK